MKLFRISWRSLATAALSLSEPHMVFPLRRHEYVKDNGDVQYAYHAPKMKSSKICKVRACRIGGMVTYKDCNSETGSRRDSGSQTEPRTTSRS